MVSFAKLIKRDFAAYGNIESPRIGVISIRFRREKIVNESEPSSCACEPDFPSLLLAVIPRDEKCFSIQQEAIVKSEAIFVLFQLKSPEQNLISLRRFVFTRPYQKFNLISSLVSISSSFSSAYIKGCRTGAIYVIIVMEKWWCRVVVGGAGEEGRKIVDTLKALKSSHICSS